MRLPCQKVCFNTQWVARRYGSPSAKSGNTMPGNSGVDVKTGKNWADMSGIPRALAISYPAIVRRNE